MAALTLLFAPSFGQAQTRVPAPEPARARPNIVLVLVDDAAFMDFGAYGGEARTPNIDRLARSGAMFTQYRTSPLCSPSRAMLLTGVDNHRAGVATIEEVLPPSQKGRKGYGLSLEPGVLTLASRLREQGYRTLMAGKWHLGSSPGALPDSHGFDRSLALDASGADNWAAKPYMPYYTNAPWFEDGKPAKLPQRFYSSDMLVEKLSGYLDERPGKAQPFFAYLAFQAVHIPVQAPRSFSDGYRGRFDGGWEKLRTERTARARALGLMPADAPDLGLTPGSRAWSELSAQERAIFARSMEVYSGMLEAMDASIGKLAGHLEARGELANTIFVVTSDNGPEPSDPVHAPGMNIWMALHGYGWRLQGLGEPGSLAYIGPEWASALAAPYQKYKFYAAEGGIRVPLVIAGPGVPAGMRTNARAFVTDVTPTLLDLAGAGPARGGVSLDGRSLAPLLSGAAAEVYGVDDPVGLEVSGNAALFRGDYKITRDMPPVGDGRWRLFNILKDPAETQDLSGLEPERMQSMLADYKAYEARVGVAPLPEGYTTSRQIAANAMARQVRQYAVPAVVLLLVVGLGVAWLLRRRARSGRRDR